MSYLKEYFKQLEGCTIVKAEVVDLHEDGEQWPVLQVKTKDGKVWNLEVSKDPEGNGPGFIFGLPAIEPEGY